MTPREKFAIAWRAARIVHRSSNRQNAALAFSAARACGTTGQQPPESQHWWYHIRKSHHSITRAYRARLARLVFVDALEAEALRHLEGLPDRKRKRSVEQAAARVRQAEDDRWGHIIEASGSLAYANHQRLGKPDGREHFSMWNYYLKHRTLLGYRAEKEVRDGLGRPRHCGTESRAGGDDSPSRQLDAPSHP